MYNVSTIPLRLVFKSLFDDSEVREVYEKFNAIADGGSTTLNSEFNRKKAAFELRNSRHKQSGNLDPLNMHLYKVSDNVFQQKRQLPVGKSHSFEILLDWSGSFSQSIGQSINQAITMCDFFRKARIPFTLRAADSADEMYTRTLSNAINSEHQSNNGGTLPVYTDKSFMLTTWLDSSMTVSEYEFSRSMLWLQGQVFFYSSIRQELGWGWKGKKKAGVEQATHAETIYNKLFSERHIVELTKNHIDWDSIPQRDRWNHTQILTQRISKYFYATSLTNTPINHCLMLVRDIMFKNKNKSQIQNLIILTDGASHHPDATKGDGYAIDPYKYVCPHTKKIYQENDSDVAMWTKGGRYAGLVAFRKTNAILGTFDWGVRRIIMFVEPMKVKSVKSAYSDTFGFAIAERIMKYKAFADNPTAVEISNLANVDKFFCINQTMFYGMPVEDKGAEAKKRDILKSFGASMQEVKSTQLIARRLADVISEQYEYASKDFEKKVEGFAIVSMKDILDGSYSKGAFEIPGVEA